MLCIYGVTQADERQEENNQRWLARYPEARDLAFDLVPVTFAFSILVGACVAVAVCITLYGGGTRKLLKQDQPFCPRCTKQGGRCGQCCSLTTACALHVQPARETGDVRAMRCRHVSGRNGHDSLPPMPRCCLWGAPRRP